VYQLLDFTAAKSIGMSFPHYMSPENLKEVMHHLEHFASQTAEHAKDILGPLIAEAVEHSGADADRLKSLLAQLTTFAHHSKVPFDSKRHTMATTRHLVRNMKMPASCYAHRGVC
jgi:hypothetical protein